MPTGISAVILCVLTRCDLNVCATYILVAALVRATYVYFSGISGIGSALEHYQSSWLVAALVCATYVLVAAVVCATCVLVAAVEAESERVQPCAWADAGVQVLPFLEVY